MKKIILTICLIQCVTIFATTPQNALHGKFSVSETKQVQFAKGNLQYHCKNQEWRFAESQLTALGTQNENISDTYDGWIDLFGRSTAKTNYGVDTSTQIGNYNGNFVDWGATMGTGWRTFTIDELKYLLGWRGKGRTDFANKWGVAQVNGINGLILLPDDWNLPDNIAAFFTFNSGKSSNDFAEQNKYTAEQWQIMEEAGAVFLPITGLREKNSMVENESENGYYWTADMTEGNETYGLLYINAGTVGPLVDSPWLGVAVRLVCDVRTTPTFIGETAEFPIYVEAGRVFCEQDFRVFDLFGRDVTRLNGSLDGVYIVKVGEKSTKVVVR